MEGKALIFRNGFHGLIQCSAAQFFARAELLAPFCEKALWKSIFKTLFCKKKKKRRKRKRIDLHRILIRSSLHLTPRFKSGQHALPLRKFSWKQLTTSYSLIFPFLLRERSSEVLKSLFFFVFSFFAKSGILLNSSDFSGFDHISSQN